MGLLRTLLSPTSHPKACTSQSSSAAWRRQLVIECLGLPLVLMASLSLATDSPGSPGRELSEHKDAFDEFPTYWYTGVPVVEALFFDPRSRWWSCLLLSTLAILLQIPAGRELREGLKLIQQLYFHGFLLSCYRANILWTVYGFSAAFVSIVALSYFPVFPIICSDVPEILKSFNKDGNTSKNTVTATSRFANLHEPVFRGFLCFFIQVALTVLYMEFLTQIEVEGIDLRKYYFAVCLNMLYEGDQGELQVWPTLWKWALAEKKIKGAEKSPADPRELGQGELFLRHGMSSVVNIGFPLVLFKTLPLFLSVSGSSIDFVKDALAIVFITELDDLKTEVTLESEAGEKKQGVGASQSFLDEQESQIEY